MVKLSKVATGVYWLEIPERDIRMVCGAPADVVKHLMRGGYIATVERDGMHWETGPNAILLSDVAIQNGEFANLAEFPVLQMFYRQGMIIPNHPNNTGQRPRIIGAADQIRAQREYIFRGNYGLSSVEELVAAGVEPELAEEYYRIKLKFAFGSIRQPEDMLDFIVVDDQPEDLAPDVDIERVAVNTYRVSFQGDYVEVSLNLDPGEQYQPPYVLGQHKIKREYFSVVHTGEGDGWDVNRPCMASVLVFQGRVYLIDAGPSVMHTLNSLGISVNEIAGIFHTHAHDDHFAGLTSLVRTDHRIPYYAAPMVRHSVMKKLSGLMSIPELHFERYFIPHDLVIDEWNMIEGLEVKPVFSPHPVETTIMFFRAPWADGYQSYAHFADICSFAQLESLEDPENPASRALIERVRRDYLTPANVKKLDIGGGMIHGQAEDFRADQSDRIVLSHKAAPLTLTEKEIGADTSFGMADVLIKATDVTPESTIVELLRQNFPGAPDHDIAMLANCPARTVSIGSIMIKKEDQPEAVYLLINGLAEALDAERGIANTLTSGALIGERGCLFGTPTMRTYRAQSFIRVLEIPMGVYRAFIERNDLRASMIEYLDRKYFLEGTFLLGDRIAGATRNAIAQEMVEYEAEAGSAVDCPESIVLVADGAIDVRCKGKLIAVARAGETVGEPAFLGEERFQMSFTAREHTRYFSIPSDLLKQIPIVSWKLLEQLNRRTRSCSALFQT